MISIAAMLDELFLSLPPFVQTLFTVFLFFVCLFLFFFSFAVWRLTSLYEAFRREEIAKRRYELLGDREGDLNDSSRSV